MKNKIKRKLNHIVFVFFVTQKRELITKIQKKKIKVK